MEFASDKIDVAGDLAYARGKFTEKYTDRKTGKAMTDSGSYLAVYKKQDDGSWKVIDDFVVADPNSAKEVAPEKPAVHAKMTSSGLNRHGRGAAEPRLRCASEQTFRYSL